MSLHVFLILRLGVPVAPSLVAFALCAHGAMATETEPPAAQTASPKFEYVLGAGIAAKPDYSGAREYGLAASPILLLRYGRYTLVGPRSGLARDPGEVSDTLTGANALLLDSNAFRVNVGLRVDSGRRASDAPQLAGLPEIKRRLLYRIGATADIAPHWSTSLRVVSDVRSIKTGSVATLSLNTRGRFTPQTTWNAALSTAYADAYYLRANFSIPEGLPRPAFQPGASLLDATLSASIRHQLYPHWSVFAAASVARLLGDAAASPLTLSPVQSNLFVGFAYHSVAVR
jgi:MipA family protein